MVGGGRFMTSREQHHFAVRTIDQVEVAGEVVAHREAAIRRSVDVPQPATTSGLPFDAHLVGAKIDDGQTGRPLATTRDAPSAPRRVLAAHFAVPHDGERYFVAR